MKREIVYLKPEEIRPDPDQSRKRITDEMVEGMTQSVRSVGLINPIEIDADNTIVTGEIRWRAAVEARLDLIPCIRWSGTPVERHTRQLIENLHHYELTSVERENGIYSLWEEIGRPSFRSLAKIIGCDHSTLAEIVRAKEFRSKFLKGVGQSNISEVSTRAISDTTGIKPERRVKILEKVATKKVKSEDIHDLKKIAKVSDELLDKTLRGEIPLKRAKRTADSFIELEKRVTTKRPNFEVSEKDKSKLISKIAEDEKKLEEYKETVLKRSVDVIGREKPVERVIRPAKRKSPAEGLRKLMVELDVDEWTLKIRLMDLNEKTAAKRYLLQILNNVKKLLEFMPED